MKMLVLVCMVVAVVLATTSAVFAVPIIIFDDEYGPGWSKSASSVYVNTDNTHNDSVASLMRNGGITIKVTLPDGLDISGTSVLQAYVNFLVSDATPGYSLTNIKVRTTNGTLFEFDDRSEGWVCYLDDIEYRDAAEIVFDTDPHTWQLFEIDLSQTDYYGWPYQARQIGNTPITGIEFSAHGNTSGAIAMLADNVRLVPEPATLGLLALGGMALICRHRK